MAYATKEQEEEQAKALGDEDLVRIGHDLADNQHFFGDCAELHELARRFDEYRNTLKGLLASKPLRTYVRNSRAEMLALPEVQSVYEPTQPGQSYIAINFTPGIHAMADYERFHHCMVEARLLRRSRYREVRAEDFRHLCSIVGLQECVARVLYKEEVSDEQS